MPLPRAGTAFSVTLMVPVSLPKINQALTFPGSQGLSKALQLSPILGNISISIATNCDVKQRIVCFRWEQQEPMNSSETKVHFSRKCLSWCLPQLLFITAIRAISLLPSLTHPLYPTCCPPSVTLCTLEKGLSFWYICMQCLAQRGPWLWPSGATVTQG